MGLIQKIFGTYSDREISQILTGFSISIFKSIKEIPGFAAGTFDRDAAFRAVIGRQGRGDIEWSKP